MTGDCEHRDGGGKGYFLEEDYNIIRGAAGNFQVSGLGRREPGSGVRVRVQVQELNFARHPHLRPEGRDLGPENEITAMS